MDWSFSHYIVYFLSPVTVFILKSTISYMSIATPVFSLFLFSLIFISWRLITLQYCSGFCHTLTWISHGFTFIPHPDPPSHLPLHPIPLGLPRAPGLSICLMHPAWAGDLFLLISICMKYIFHHLIFIIYVTLGLKWVSFIIDSKNICRCSVAKHVWLCNLKDCSMSASPVLHYHPHFA